MRAIFADTADLMILSGNGNSIESMIRIQRSLKNKVSFIAFSFIFADPPFSIAEEKYKPCLYTRNTLFVY